MWLNRPSIYSCWTHSPGPFVLRAHNVVLQIHVFHYDNFVFPTIIWPSPSHFLKIQLKLHVFQDVFGCDSVLCQLNWVGLWYLEFPSLHCSKVELIARTFLWDLEGENEAIVIFRLLKSVWVLSTVALDLFAHLLVWVAPVPAVLPAATSSSPSACASLWQNMPASSVYLLHH